MRIPLLLLCALALSGCDVLLQQRIVQANLRVPHPPAPILPLDSTQRFSVQGSVDASITDLPAGAVLGDSGSPLRMRTSPLGGAFQAGFHHRMLQVGEEIGNGRGTIYAGVNIQTGAIQFLGWGGLSLITWSQDVLYKKGWGEDSGYTIDYWTSDRDTGAETGGAVSLGLAVQSGAGVVRPFAAARLDLGPTIDGTSWIDDSPKADNPISLSQLQLDAGIRLECASWIHAYAGAGTRMFLSEYIHGNDWRVFGGVSMDILRNEPR